MISGNASSGRMIAVYHPPCSAMMIAEASLRAAALEQADDDARLGAWRACLAAGGRGEGLDEQVARAADWDLDRCDRLTVGDLPDEARTQLIKTAQRYCDLANAAEPQLPGHAIEEALRSISRKSQETWSSMFNHWQRATSPDGFVRPTHRILGTIALPLNYLFWRISCDSISIRALEATPRTIADHISIRKMMLKSMPEAWRLNSDAIDPTLNWLENI
jgi:hypothetical protein